MRNYHHRPTEYRNLYRATPTGISREEKLPTWERDTRRLVDKGHSAFWRRRGINPPRVSDRTLGSFDLPDTERTLNEC